MIDPRLIEAVETLIAAHSRSGSVPLIAISGAQGSGKTTLARAAAARTGAAHLSLDDVYLTRAERDALARTVHPLFATRGPPGTHDLGLLHRVIDALSRAGSDARTPLPVFDKRADDRLAPEDWPVFTGRPAAILLDGWCLGAMPHEAAALIAPVNDLERQQDPDGRWRRAVNDELAGPCRHLFARFDALLFLRAPTFDGVLDWRCEQEAGLMGLAPADLPATERARLAGFIGYFERITRSMIDGWVVADVVVSLDRERRVTGIERL
ncbi:kinase [uncultured Brevundimonas sp.]|uniref:kinase n=1 Tax=uncultured Brevundimonas sp. TaxID=213418 RepID=UPI0030ED9CFA|tara:strand:+ start:22943 stop:23743 length:801 start_codon:yes stop_codon:yes gene_type:complete